jgi:hypothetical protein
MMAESKSIKLAVLVIVGFLGLALRPGYQAADAAEIQRLFLNPPYYTTAQDKDAAVDPTIVRSRFVNVNWNALKPSDALSQGAAPDQGVLVLDLFPDVSLRAVLGKRHARSNESFTWEGHAEGDPGSQITLVVENGVILGNIRVANAYFQVRYAGAGLHVVRQIDESLFPPEGEPIPVDLPYSTAEDLGMAAADDGSTFDVMVVYTPAARAAAGGTAAMNALIQLAVSETNTAYSRSGVIPRLRLVHAEEVSYTESGDFGTDLDRITDPSDGFMDNVHALRNAHGADLVSLIIDGTSLCGIAWVMTNQSNAFQSFAFNVVSWLCATGNFTFGHELGHNMGLKHDRINDNNPGVLQHSHGYVDIAHGFRTIMGVQTNPPCCSRIQNFSNPNVNFNGHPTGVSQGSPQSADAAASLNAVALTVANWRQEVVSPAVALDFDGEHKSDLAVYETNGGNWFFVGASFSSQLNFGGVNFLTVPGDYDGDGETDTAVYDTTNGNWSIMQSTAGFKTQPGFGGPGYVPAPGDYDGDGKTDVGIYQTSTGHWFYMGSTSGFGQQLGFGGPGFIPVPADYDGDGETDTAVYETGTGHWFINQSTAGFRVHPSFGGAGFIPMPGDYDGDEETDLGVYQVSTGHWFFVGSTAGFGQHLAFGGSGFIPVPGDYDGDGETDTAVYQQSTGHWFIAQSTAGFRVHPSFGGAGFVPVLPQVTILRAMGLL